MKIVTSFSPSRAERQNQCLASWIKLGCTVVGVQSPGESDRMADLYPSASFVETELVGDLFGKPHFVRMKAIIDQAVDEPILILNSDIEIRMTPDRFSSEWEIPAGKALKVGIRWDVNARTNRYQLLKWGIDAFLITPDIAKHLPDIGLTMGCPVWDYWIPWHMHSLGYQILTNKNQGLFHVVHNRNWSMDDYHTGWRLVAEHYGENATDKALTTFIQNVTGRKRLSQRSWSR